MMKSDIDLRPAEFVRLNRSPRRRFMLGLLAVSAASLLFLFIILAEGNLSRLSLKLYHLRQTNKSLTAEAAALIHIETWISELENKASLLDALQLLPRPWSSHLRQVEEALPENFNLTGFTADEQGQLIIAGSGPFLTQIAAYNQILNGLDFITSSSVSKIGLLEAGSYYFTIRASLEENEAYVRSEGQSESEPLLPPE